MKATINLEFTDKELTDLAERWATKALFTSLGDVGKQVEPLMPLIRDFVMRAVAGASPGVTSPPRGDAGGDRRAEPARRPTIDPIRVYEEILECRPADAVTIIVQKAVDGYPIGDKVMLTDRPVDGAALHLSLQGLHARSLYRSRPTTYAISFYDESKSLLAQSSIRFIGEPPATDPSNVPTPPES